MHCRLVLLGPPAAGKGTQAELLKSRFGFLAPSIGAILREQKAAGSAAGLTAAEYFDRGLLVPDEITIGVVNLWLAGREGCWAMDGFPRTVRQAQAFDEILAEQGNSLDRAILIQADEPVIRDRVAHRLVCKRCGSVWRQGMHVPLPSQPCPHCGGALSRRIDDSEEALIDRLREYREKTEPVISYYQSRGIIHTVDGNRPVEAVFADISAELEAAA